MKHVIFEKQNNFLKNTFFVMASTFFVFSSCVFRTPDDFVKSDISSNETEKTFYKVLGSADDSDGASFDNLSADQPAFCRTGKDSTTTKTNSSSSEINSNITSSVRTALPYTTSIKYFVTATDDTKKATITSDDFDLGSDFSLDLYSATWTLTATAYYSSDAEKTSIMSGSEKVTVESSDIADIFITLLPTTSGTGTVALNFGFSETYISYATASWTIDSKLYSKKITSGTVSSFDLIPDSSSANTYTKVPSGIHQVVFVFYDSADEPKYHFIQTINVFDGMTTNSWQANSNEEYIDTTNNQIFVTDAMVSAFVSKVCYVSSIGSDFGDGSFFAPYATIQKAVTVLQNANDKSSLYKIYLKDDLTATDDDFTTDFTNGNSLIVISPSSTFNLTIEPFEKSSITINANRNSNSSTNGRIFYIGENANVTLKNLVLTGGYSDGDGGAIHVAGSSDNSPVLMLLNCEIGKTNDSILALSDGTQNTTYAPNSTTSSNSSVNGGAIYATYAKVILESTKVLNNYATLDGGGIYISNTMLTINKDSEIYANGATAKSPGSTPTVSSSISAKDSSTIELFGKIHHHYSSTLYVSSGIYLSSSNLNMYSGAEICDNYSAESYYHSGVYLSDENSKLNAIGGSIKNNSYFGSSIYNFDIFYTGFASGITLGADVYVETIYSLSAAINVSSTLTTLSNSQKCKIYTTITNGNPVIQATSAIVSISDCVDFFELYGSDYQKSSGYELKLDTSETLQKLVISKILYETVYLDTTNGDDTNTGKSYDIPVKTLEVAVSRLNKNATNPTIYVMSNISVSSDESSSTYWTFDLADSKPNVTLKRYDGVEGGSAFTGSILTLSSGGTVNATGIIFDGNSSAGIKGSAPLVDVESGGTLTLNNCYLQNNTSSKPTGGIKVSGTVSLYDCSVKNNTATRAGGILIDTSETFYMKDGEISRNIATTDNGGGLQVTNGKSNQIFLKNVSITENTATKANGGGIAISSAKYLTLESCTITGNSATAGSGGGIYIAGNLSLFGTTDISDNTCDGYGANICWPNDTNSKTIAIGTDSTTSFTLGGQNVTPSALTMASGKSIVATITPAISNTSYENGTQLLKSASLSGPLSDFVDLFTIDDDDTTDNYTWYIDDEGKLQKRTAADVSYYVSSNGSDSNDGTKNLPFATVQKAVNIITASIDTTKTYAIFLLSDITATSSSTFTDSSFVKIAPTTALNLTIESYAGKVYAINAGGASVALGRCLYINTATASTITLNNVQVTGGYTTSANGGGVYIAGSSSAQPTLVLDGDTIIGNKIEVTDGIKATSDLLTATDFGNVANGNGGGIYASYANITMNGNSSVAHNETLKPTGNATGSGICIEGASSTLTVGNENNHTPSIYGNYSNSPNSRGAINTSGPVYFYGTLHHNVNSESSGIEVFSQELFIYDGSSIYDNSAIGNFGGAIHTMDTSSNNEKIYIYGGTFSNNHTESSSNYEINFLTVKPDSCLYINPTKVTFDDYNYAIKIGDGSCIYPLSSFASAGNTYKIKLDSYTEGNVVLKGSDLPGSEYILTESDLNYVKAIIGSDATEYSLKLDSTNNQATIDIPSSSSGSLTVKINDNISMSLSSSELSTTDATTLTLTTKVDGTQVAATISNTTVSLYNGGVLYADSSVTTSVSANNIINISGAVAPGSYQLLVTFIYEGTKYQATFDLTADIIEIAYLYNSYDDVYPCASDLKFNTDGTLNNVSKVVFEKWFTDNLLSESYEGFEISSTCTYTYKSTQYIKDFTLLLGSSVS